jgi:hypothetical protein
LKHELTEKAAAQIGKEGTHLRRSPIKKHSCD